jgi:hypothetical protein
MEIRRDTTADLFRAAWREARDAGQLNKLLAIIDYELAADYCAVPVTNYEFDVHFCCNYGGSEGIYIDAWIDGNFDEKQDPNENKRAKIGTIKTLYTSLEAMQVMGEACGTLTHFASQYINRELDRYTPRAELIRTMERRAARAAAAAAAQ